MSVYLGCIADDLIGATELAGLLARSGVAVNLRLGVPPDAGAAAYPAAVDPVATVEVIALNCRTAPIDETVRDALAAWRWLSARGAARCYWSYGSTSVSSPDGHVGPVAEALLDELGATPRTTVHAPASPRHGRTVLGGKLHVNGAAPADDPPHDRAPTSRTGGVAARPLARQVPGGVGTLALPTVRAGREAIAQAVRDAATAGVAHVIGDSVEDTDLVELVRGTEHLALLCGGNAFASHLPALARVRGWIIGDTSASVRPRPGGLRLVLAGTHPAATRARLEAWPDAWPTFRLNAADALDDAALGAARGRLAEALARTDAPLLVHGGAGLGEATSARAEPGARDAHERFELASGELAVEAVARGVGQLVVAGDRSSAAVVRALGLARLGVGAEIAPGVPWCRAELDGPTGGAELAVAMVPNDVGGPDLFAEAFARLAEPVPPAPPRPG